jgi:hypothetical protein
MEIYSDIVKVKKFVAVVKKKHDANETIAHAFSRDPESRYHSAASEDSRMEVAYATRRQESHAQTNSSVKEPTRLLLGDDSEWHDSLGQKSMANAAFVEFNLKSKYIQVKSSIIGLPPIFIYKDRDMVIIASDLYLLTMIPGLNLYFDENSIRDLCYIGHPVNHRTLFKDVTIITGGYSLTVNGAGDVTMEKNWSFPIVEPLTDWNAYTGMQLKAFQSAMRAIDLSNSFLSLTAGLDTRTILAALIQNKQILSAYTMSGKTTSLDARTARHLCNVYGMNHKIIEISDEFIKRLPDYIIEASRLSGGLASLEQAHEVYFYQKTDGVATARLSGYLGNQVGRRGTEKIALRNADDSMFNEETIKTRKTGIPYHWYEEAKLNDGGLDYEFLVQKEVPFSSIANYCIGNHFVIQQSPYASCRLIETLCCMPQRPNAAKPLSLLQMRVKDLRHRFLGESELHSFQVRMIKEAGGYVASCPINWGWRAKGGVSFAGVLMGGLTFLDVLVSSKGSELLYKGLEVMNIAGLHEYTPFKAWMKYLRDFVYDTVLSKSVRTSGLFNEKKIESMLNEHYMFDKNHYRALTTSLDLALAQQIFRAKL